MSLEQSIQVSTATLRAATTRHDKLTGSVEIPPHLLTVASEREESEGVNALNRLG